MIHVIGDSHVSVFSGLKKIVPFYNGQDPNWDSTPYFKTYRLGPIIAYNLINKIHMFEKLLMTLDKKKDILLFNFGEIDCRFHIPKRVHDKQETIDFVVQDCIDRYVNILEKLPEWKIIFSGSQPSTWMDKYESVPIFGDEVYRNNITKIFNNKLDQKAKMVSIFDKLINPDMTTKREYYMDIMHLDGSKCIGLIIEQFKIAGLI